jgi:hypothetical protein
LSSNPVEEVGVHLRTHRFHEITSKAVASRRINVQDTEPWVKPEGGGSEAAFRFQ